MKAARSGPRPLGYHLGTALATYLGSLGALPLLRNGSLPWKPALEARAAELARDVQVADPKKLAAALEREVRARTDRFLSGIEAYRGHPYRRALTDPPAVWAEGTTRLLDYGPPEGRPVLVAPSLINRAYVLDLVEGRSLLRHLSVRGFRPLLVDWGKPGDVERGFDLDAYIAGRLERALDAALEITHEAPLVLGYCMGGDLALALSTRRPRDVAALALLATPWDFHAERPEQARALAALMAPLWPFIDQAGEMPVDLLQILFAGLDPYLSLRKFQGFAALEPSSADAEAFVALEDWANDGVPLAAPVAHACMTGWYGRNDTAHGEWRVAGRAVDPAAVASPALVIVPERDRIVPPKSALALAHAIPGAKLVTTGLGHIGMIVGARAPAEVWTPLATWLASIPGRKARQKA
ncbi:MAG: alpha/beta fold hydrolase [Alphaproteobacteria bacterium]|nr:alpha/beta fold hydrolase [Alphaproteobacteria bacterium]